MPLNKTTTLAVTLAIGVALGVTASYFFAPKPESIQTTTTETKKTPLYWVAPMDNNYRRDEPGQSPMGMDLVPVYEDNAADDFGPGAVKIAPHVINNLGVRTAKVTSQTMNTSISTVGYVQYDEDYLVHIHPRVEGWIDKLYVKAAGNPVQKDAPLYQLYSPQLVNAQEEFLIALKRNNQALVTAAKERLAALQLSAGFIKELEKNKVVKQSVTFYAPQSGVVDGLKVREGFYVKPGTTLMSIGKPEQVWVEAEIFERDTALIQSGLPVSMTLDYLPSRQWTGVVEYVYPALDAKTRTLRVRLKFDNADLALKPNMFAQVSILADSLDNAIIVPKESVIRTGKQDRVVLALGDGQFKSIEVKIGRVDNGQIEIIKGLTTEDVVVTSAQFLIDSESSKSSDFKRMSHDSTASSVSSATVNGVINHIDRQSRILNISRDAIEKWQRPAATMDFLLADGIDIHALNPAQAINFTFEVRDELVITAIEPVKPASDNAHSNH
ncbi:efflux RND transporter periplasmic adaptor subunit [Alteromonadaceae bacterium BrNp21-10]|nr:efflux RND transporter periplasmic adaptor subunit [Alteromonadaceae bacterium BrNp21-10]